MTPAEIRTLAHQVECQNPPENENAIELSRRCYMALGLPQGALRDKGSHRVRVIANLLESLDAHRALYGNIVGAIKWSSGWAAELSVPPVLYRHREVHDRFVGRAATEARARLAARLWMAAELEAHGIPISALYTLEENNEGGVP